MNGAGRPLGKAVAEAHHERRHRHAVRIASGREVDLFGSFNGRERDHRIISWHAARLFERPGPTGLEGAHPGDECLRPELGGDDVVAEEATEKARTKEGIRHAGSVTICTDLNQRARRPGDGMITLKLDHALVAEVAADT